MLTREENELLTRTGPGTPGGELMRRYWQPVALEAELPPGSPPLPVRLLGEDLVLFRDEAGRPGLLGVHCAHRGADLSYGRLEDGGLRCIYHGWLYDATGHCLEQPGEPAGSSFHERVRQPAYPCVETGGFILAYLGPGEPPLVPGFDFLHAPPERREVAKVIRACNYLQGNEGNFDPHHVPLLHWTAAGAFGSAAPLGPKRRWLKPTTEIETTEFGVRLYAIQEAPDGATHVGIHLFIVPNFSAFSFQEGGDGYGVNWHVPIDDTAHWVYRVQFSRDRQVDHEAIRKSRLAPSDPVRNRANRYRQDREEMTERSFAGLGVSFPDQDACVTEGAGPIQDRTQENLGANDKCIAASRLFLLRAIRELLAGKEPPMFTRNPLERREIRLVAGGIQVPAGVDWRGYVRELIGEKAAV
ncbi:MAG TPA: Rieske 2Fe-2S domain-containing protein [Chloroflexota bacterium]|nr:Rieske 2Fe-2S domain-containing protein [Chloroflexota bacterium]